MKVYGEVNWAIILSINDVIFEMSTIICYNLLESISMQN